MKLITTLFLILATLLGSVSGMNTPNDTSTASAVPTMAVTETAAANTQKADDLISLAETGRGVSYDEMVYADYDDGPFYTAVEKLYTLADDGQNDQLLALYDQLYEQVVYVSTMSELAYIRYCDDVYDDDWAQAYQDSSAQAAQCADALFQAGNYITQSECADAFADHMGQDDFDALVAYEAVSDRELELCDQELSLVNDYYRLLDEIYEQTYSYQGRSWDWDMFYGYQGDALAETDYDGYVEVYYGLQKAAAELIAPTYAQLVSLRRELAQLNGYDSYNDYAYELTYGRDYTPADAQSLCDAVKEVAQTYYENYYYSDMYYAYDEVEPVMDTQALLDTLGQYVTYVDQSLAEPLEFMESMGLYDIAMGDGRTSGAYTTVLSLYDSPFIFMNQGGDCWDFLTLSHEYGHYCNDYFSGEGDLLDIYSYDLLEIHSNGLQALLTQWYGEIFTQGADVAEFINLSDLMENLVEGCIQDEFQRRIYDCEEELTAETVNRIYSQVYSEYNPYIDVDTWNSGWLYVAHNFESPLYYISYAASAVAALQLWDMAQTDPEAAAQTYMAVQNAGGINQGYCQVLTDCGLRLFTQDGVVAQVCQPVMERLSQLTYND